MTPRTDVRDRMIQSAALLFRERGVSGTAFSDVLEHANAPRGSVYHHFPGGKDELALDATRYAGDFLAAGLATALAEDDPIAAIETFASLWMQIVRDSDYTAGCPIVAAALEGVRTPAVRDVAGEVFSRWEQLIADAIATQGVPEEEARSAATLAVSAIEGAIILTRAQQSTAPLERVTDQLKRLAPATLGLQTSGEGGV